MRRFFKHPFYIYPELYHDIAVVELGRRIEYDFDKFGDSPACLDQGKHPPDFWLKKTGTVHVRYHQSALKISWIVVGIWYYWKPNCSRTSIRSRCVNHRLQRMWTNAQQHQQTKPDTCETCPSWWFWFRVSMLRGNLWRENHK